jgi:KUP system potassium uptake protein
MNYNLETYGTDCIFRIRLNLGFQCPQRVNVYLRQIVQDMKVRGEFPPQNKKYSIYGPSDVGSFKFCIIHKSVTTKTELSNLDEFILNSKYAIRKAAGSRERWYGLDTSSLIRENVPLITSSTPPQERISRE